jgi:TatD DNase family protein
VIDTHCHLTDPRLASQIDAVLARAKAVGVTRIITIGCEPDDDREAIALCRRYPDRLRCAVGIHPNYCGEVDKAAIEVVRTLLVDPMVVALGEIGLDYFRDTAPRDSQREFFVAQLRIAAELNRPVVLHAREAIDDTLGVLAEFPSIRALFHSFTGTPGEAGRISDRGYLIGFTGPVTYKKNDALREAAAIVPIGQIVVETDAPYLSPEPLRNQRVNEPSYVVHVARKIAEVRGLAYDAFDRISTANAERFFGW